ncbi:hypothetical protein [Actinoplanes couchii]|uniref:DUF5666 domain-containing protein n=1 Tax=Actinoplanes couchii TaxID=403638 RepID=A0ABQ3X1K8_9ACTN|nr:hypothetical protein [Actinoplanes couchii]MDR6316753.1 hypothetical protein [Actinoplanes couchii]GID52361.1 hypothetical protein Aco03nite_007650 [Actinoplanes couchii]
MTTLNDETAIIPAVSSAGDGLSAELAAAAPKKWWNKGTVVLGVAALLMGGFVGGIQAQKQWGTSASASASGFPGGGGRGGFPSGMSASGAPGGGFGQRSTETAAASAGTTGKVKLVNGKTIYVETEDGSVVTVKTDGDTTVSTASKGKLSDVRTGQSITVEGETGTDGTVTAKTVTATK